MNTILEVRGLAKRFGSLQALDDVSLQLATGEILGLLGPNGAGKTTLVRAIVGRVIPDSGEIKVHGEIGWIPQEIALYPDLSVRENLDVSGRYHGLKGKPLDDAIERALSWSELSDRRRDVVKKLSGGMKRRLNMAAGVLHDPKVILMDEPTVGVDPQSREKIYSMIGELRQRGVSLIYTTHYMEEAERLCDRIAVIDHGKIIAEGTKDQLVRTTIGEKREAVVHTSTEIPGPLREQLLRRGAVVDGNVARLQIADPRREIKEIFDLFDAQSVKIDDLSLRAPTLERVFLHLTGRELRE